MLLIVHLSQQQNLLGKHFVLIEDDFLELLVLFNLSGTEFPLPSQLIFEVLTLVLQTYHYFIPRVLLEVIISHLLGRDDVLDVSELVLFFDGILLEQVLELGRLHVVVCPLPHLRPPLLLSGGVLGYSHRRSSPSFLVGQVNIVLLLSEDSPLRTSIVL